MSLLRQLARLGPPAVPTLALLATLGGCLRASDRGPKEDTTKDEVLSADDAQRRIAMARLQGRAADVEAAHRALAAAAVGADPARARRAIDSIVQLAGAPLAELLASSVSDEALMASTSTLVPALLEATQHPRQAVARRAMRLLARRGAFKTEWLRPLHELDRTRCGSEASVVIRSPSGIWTEDDGLVFVELPGGQSLFVNFEEAAAQSLARTATGAASACDRGAFGVSGKPKTLTVALTQDRRPDVPHLWAFTLALDAPRISAIRRDLGPSNGGLEPAPGGFTFASDPLHEPRGGCHDKCTMDRFGRRYRIQKLVEGSLPAWLRVSAPGLETTVDVERTLREAPLELKLLFPIPADLGRTFRLDAKDPARRLAAFAVVSLDDGSRCWWVSRDMSWPDEPEAWPCKGGAH